MMLAETDLNPATMTKPCPRCKPYIDAMTSLAEALEYDAPIDAICEVRRVYRADDALPHPHPDFTDLVVELRQGHIPDCADQGLTEQIIHDVSFDRIHDCCANFFDDPDYRPLT